MKVLIFDFETGGLDFKIHSPLSIGACVADLDSKQIVDQYETLIKLPSYNVQQEALAINGLSVAECEAKGIEPEKIAEKLMDMWMTHACSLIGGHNFHFDQRFAAHWLFGVEPHQMDRIFTHRYLDTYPCIQLMMGSQNAPPGTSLKQCIKFFDIDMKDVKGGYHQALYDVIATARLMMKFREIMGAK